MAQYKCSINSSIAINKVQIPISALLNYSFCYVFSYLVTNFHV